MPTKRHTTKPRRSGRDRVLALATQRGMLRSRDLAGKGLSREVLRRLHASGELERRGRGIYVVAGTPLSEHETIAAVTARVPHSVICLLSALRLHDLTTQNPADVWIAIDRKARAPVEHELPLRIVRFSGKALTTGIEERVIDGVIVRVYNAAKTVVDCFKYRRKIGSDVAIEALRDCWRSRRCTMDELWKYAAVCRMTNVMRPYLEAVAVEDGPA